MELKRNRPVMEVEMFEKVHRKGPDGPFSDPKGEQTMATYKELVEQATTASQGDRTVPPINHDVLFCQAVGVSARGRLYSVGSHVIGGSAHNVPSSSYRIIEQDMQEAINRATSKLWGQFMSQIEQQNERYRRLEQ